MTAWGCPTHQPIGQDRQGVPKGEPQAPEAPQRLGHRGGWGGWGARGGRGGTLETERVKRRPADSGGT